jgi:hypothetical protein
MMYSKSGFTNSKPIVKIGVTGLSGQICMGRAHGMELIVLLT